MYCTVLYYSALLCTVLYCTVLYCTVLYCTVLYCTVLYCTVLYCTVLYCTVLYCTIVYCTEQMEKISNLQPIDFKYLGAQVSDNLKWNYFLQDSTKSVINYVGTRHEYIQQTLLFRKWTNTFLRNPKYLPPNVDYCR